MPKKRKRFLTEIDRPVGNPGELRDAMLSKAVEADLKRKFLNEDDHFQKEVLRELYRIRRGRTKKDK